MLKRFVFAMLIIWALVDAVISARQAPSFSIGVVLFVDSIFWSGLFIVLLAVIWNWVGRRVRSKRESENKKVVAPQDGSFVEPPMRVIGKLFSGLGGICFCVFGIWAIFLSLSIVHEVTGFWGFVIAFTLFPITLVAAPWYALFHWGTWFPLAISYGGFILASVLKSIGGSLSRD
jgi:hypothetical protein